MQTDLKPALVRSDWHASYDEPIRLQAGAALVLSGRSDLWDGHRWLWARDPDGREGWIPDDLIRTDPAGQSVAARDFSALELSCVAGQVLQVLEQTHGWALCQDAEGRRGWVPAGHLEITAAKT